MADRWKHADQEGRLELSPIPAAEAERPDAEVDVPALRQSWEALQDTHDFFHMLRKHHVTRTQALRLIGDDFARPVAADSLQRVVELAHEAETPFMTFVGNRGCIQIHTGRAKKIVRIPDWFNVMDPGFNLHVYEPGLRSAWIVRKPTSDGIVTALEVYDEQLIQYGADIIDRRLAFLDDFRPLLLSTFQAIFDDSFDADLRYDAHLIHEPHAERPTRSELERRLADALYATRDEERDRGYTVVDAPTVMSTHLTEILKTNMPDLLSYGEVAKLLNDLPKEQAKLVEDLIPGQISLTGVQRILQFLLGERVSIRDLGTILEGVAEAVSWTRNPASIAEHVRARLARQLCAQYTSPEGTLPLVVLSPQWEQAFQEAIVGQGDDRQLAMAPSQLQEFITRVREAFEAAAQAGELPVLLTSPGIRPFVRSIIERFRSQTTVLSQNEIHPQAKLKTVGQI